MAAAWWEKACVTQAEVPQCNTCSSGHVTLHQNGMVTRAQVLVACKNSDSDGKGREGFPGQENTCIKSMEEQGVFHVRYRWRGITATCKGSLGEE